MVSNALSSRRGKVRPPVVCHAPPKPPIRPLELTIDVYPNPCTVNEYCSLEIWADHPSRPKGEPYIADWDPGEGRIDPPPPTYNRELGMGTWIAPSYPCTTYVKATCTWVDGTKVFATVSVKVLPP